MAKLIIQYPEGDYVPGESYWEKLAVEVEIKGSAVKIKGKRKFLKNHFNPEMVKKIEDSGASVKLGW
jgi:ribosomal protein L6P/L9E